MKAEIEYIVVKDNLDGGYNVYVKRTTKYLFGYLKFTSRQGILSNGMENGNHPSTAFNQNEAVRYIEAHKRRYQLRAVGNETSVFKACSVDGKLELLPLIVPTYHERKEHN